MRYFILLLLVAVLRTVNAQEVPGLVVSYKMDNSCELTDETADSPVHGVLNDISLAADRSGVANAALAFNVNTAYITLGVVEKLKIAGDKSFSFWIKPAITGADRTGSIFTYGNAIVIGYVEQSSVAKLSIKFGSTQYQIVNLKNQWQIVTVTFAKDFSATKSRAAVYIDGIFSVESQQNKSAQDFTDVIAVMGPASQLALTNGFRGTLDDMRFYNRVLTDAEISNAALPVILESFAAQRIDGAIELRWKTSAEENFSHFNIQRSTDGVQFTSIAKVSGGKENYVARDAAAPDTELWYRLEMVDKDDTKQLSKTVRIGRNATGPALTIVFPNPAGDVLNFRGIPSNHLVDIISAAGSHVKQERMANAISIRDLAPGLYYVVIYDEHGNKKLVSKFIKRKN